MTIIQELGNLALAVAQPGAYIFQSECGLDRDLEMHRENRGTLLMEYGDSVQKVDDYKWMVHTTWEISFKRLSGQSATFLCLCAFLYHDCISKENFQNTMSNITAHKPCFAATARKIRCHEGERLLGYVSRFRHLLA